MQIQDFYAKLVSNRDQNPLFVALRKLTQVSDPKAAFKANDDGIESWATWVPASTQPV